MRRERDSNPRYGFPYSGFQDRLFKPLTHPSVIGDKRRVLVIGQWLLVIALLAIFHERISITNNPITNSQYSLLGSYYLAPIASMPFMYCRSAAGTVTDPSFC